MVPSNQSGGLGLARYGPDLDHLGLLIDSSQMIGSLESSWMESTSEPEWP